MVQPVPIFEPGRFRCVAIGSSTGAPSLLENMLSNLPADLPFPIVVAQHFPPAFSDSFSKRLAQKAALNVVHAEEGQPLLPGTIYIGRGHQHFRVVGKLGRYRVNVSPEPVELAFKPSVDELFTSVSSSFGFAALGIVMTGIGRDGTKGAIALRAAGGVILTQDKASCAVWGMPRSCEEAGASDATLTPEQFRLVLLQFSSAYREQALEQIASRPSVRSA